jgi:hypothetical protein
VSMTMKKVNKLKEIHKDMELLLSNLNDANIELFPDDKCNEAIRLEEMYVNIRDQYEELDYFIHDLVLNIFDKGVTK